MTFRGSFEHIWFMKHVFRIERFGFFLPESDWEGMSTKEISGNRWKGEFKETVSVGIKVEGTIGAEVQKRN